MKRYHDRSECAGIEDPIDPQGPHRFCSSRVGDSHPRPHFNVLWGAAGRAPDPVTIQSLTRLIHRGSSQLTKLRTQAQELFETGISRLIGPASPPTAKADKVRACLERCCVGKTRC